MSLARFRRFIAAESAATGLPLGALVLVAVALHLTVALLAVNPWHPDEHFQVLEFAWARAGRAPTDALPWEFAARIRPALQPVLAMGVLQATTAMGLRSPYAWVLALRLTTLALALTVLLHVVAHAAPARTRSARQALWLIALGLWFAPLFTSRFTSENLGGIALAAALPFVEGKPSERRDGWVGALLGLAFVLRFQMAFAIGALLLWVTWQDGRARATRIGAGALAVVALGSLVDRWFYGAWVFTPWEYFRTNLIEGVAASFGTSPWYAYPMGAALWMAPPLGIALVGLLAVAVLSRPRSPWVWAFAAFALGHSLVAHKELRFLLPILYLVPVLAALGVDAIARRGTAGRWPRIVAGGLLAQNAVLALLVATPAIHRGKDFDWHYYRFLWEEAEERPDGTTFVLQEGGRPYQAWDWDAHVYRHPRVSGVDHVPGEPLPNAVSSGTPADALLVMTRSPEPPLVAGATGYDLVYEAEPGYRRMARWIGADESALVRRLESVDRWIGSPWVRRVYRVHEPWAVASSDAGDLHP